MYDWSVRTEARDELESLGYKKACLIKSFKNWKEYESAKQGLDQFYLLGAELKADSARELITKSKQFKQADYVTINNPNPKVFRAGVEKGLVDSVSGLELIKGYDKFHQRRTLLNNVTAKLMNKNKVSVVLEFANLKRTWGVQRAVIWGRMKYNTWICIKKKVPIIIAGGASNKGELIDPEVLKAFGQLLGMNAGQAKQGLSFVQEKIIHR